MKTKISSLVCFRIHTSEESSEHCQFARKQSRQNWNSRGGRSGVNSVQTFYKSAKAELLLKEEISFKQRKKIRAVTSQPSQSLYRKRLGHWNTELWLLLLTRALLWEQPGPPCPWDAGSGIATIPPKKYPNTRKLTANSLPPATAPRVLHRSWQMGSGQSPAKLAFCWLCIFSSNAEQMQRGSGSGPPHA